MGTEIPVSRAAKMLKCARTSIYRYLESGRLDGYQLCEGGWWRVYYDSVVDMINRAKGASNAAGATQQ
jgi:excisionase family DNA binding protein